MIKELIDLQKNSKATCAIIKTDEYKTLSPIVSMEANVSNKFLLSGDKPPFAEKIDNLSKQNSVCYFVIKNIDKIDIELQDRFISLVKDRQLNNYTLPDNCIIVFTVKDAQGLTNISSNLYHFSTIAF